MHIRGQASHLGGEACHVSLPKTPSFVKAESCLGIWGDLPAAVRDLVLKAPVMPEDTAELWREIDRAGA
jgi:hypothetical protein